MVIYVLTQREGKTTAVVATASTEAAARQWFSAAPGNDYCALELDALEHLGLSNGDKKADMPAMPVNTGDPFAHMASLSEYMKQLADRMESQSADMLKRVDEATEVVA